MRQHHAEMTRVCCFVTGDAAVAEEAVAAAWPIAWGRLGGLREPERLRPWLVAIAVNEARQIVRRSRGPVATRLADGRVLLVGGLTDGRQRGQNIGGPAVTTVELFE